MESLGAFARSRPVRLAVGAIVGVALLVITLARVDLGSVGSVIAGASVSAIGVAVTVVLIDLAIRGLRWKALLDGLGEGRASPSLAIGYLAIGYLANLILPARLGDLARAYLAGSAFQRPRLATLGTIVVERVADGTTMLALAIVASLLVAGVATVQQLVFYGSLLALVALVGAVVAWGLIGRTALGETPIGRFVRDVVARLAAGTAALRTGPGAATVLVSTLTVAGTATLVAWIVSASVGVALSPAQAALFMSAIALSLAIPAAPGSLGTYEFVGVIVLTSLGHSAEQALATIVLMRAVSTFPPIALGIIATWVLHLRPAVLLETADAEVSEMREGATP